MSTAWLLLLAAGLLEVVWAVGLKYTDGFSRLAPSAITIAAMIGSVWLLAICTVGMTAARILILESPDPNRVGPFLSANDRSRWCTIRSLVEYQSFAIDAVIEGTGGERWDTIDKVYHAGPDGRMHFYSSKPSGCAGRRRQVYGLLGYAGCPKL